MPDVNWEGAYCGDGNSCHRVGTDEAGKSYISVSGVEEHFLTDSREALQQMIRDNKAGKADHLL
ncbi:hypothetical protein [Streptomyces sp. NPDC102437]|uniref:hypothetical protein n=1 Tax=Streptomyces sp. NPDC102437 TaxID=3366175 RepID=UPI0038014EC9